MINAILFDKDGTLFDFYRTWGPVTEDAALLVAGGDLAKARYVLEKSGKDMVTGKYVPSSPIASGSNRQIVETWCAILGIAEVEPVYEKVHEMFLARQKQVATPVLELEPFFARLKGRGLRLGVATMDSEESARAAMRIFKAERHLDFICGFDTGHGMKPSGGMVEAFARLTATPPANVAVVGDSPHDIHMAHAGKAGRAIGVLTGVSPREALIEAGADEVIDSIADLERVI